MIAPISRQMAGDPVAKETSRFLGDLASQHRQFGYDGADSSRNRKNRSTAIMTEADHLPPAKRRSLVSRTREQTRNFVVAAWAVRKHLDWITTFSCQARTKDRGFNKELEDFVKYGCSSNCRRTG